MKKKLFSVLLALTLCGSLAIPVFAGPAEETQTPEETTPLEVAPPEETVLPEEIGFLPCEDPHEYESENAVLTWDCELSDYSDGNFVSWTWTEKGNIVMVRCGGKGRPTSANAFTMPGSSSSDEEIHSVSSGHTHILEILSQKTYWETNNSGHRWVTETKAKCTEPGCGSEATLYDYNPQSGDFEPHSWSKGSFAGYQSNAVGHKALYNYSCSKCRATKTDGASEPHSMRESYTGSNYHQGTKHYFEYEYECTQCGYTKTQYKSYSCPGPQGGGCILPDTPINKVEPPVEVQDVTEPEDAAMPKETVLPEEIVTPEETVLPEDTTEPENTDTPEETT